MLHTKRREQVRLWNEDIKTPVMTSKRSESCPIAIYSKVRALTPPACQQLRKGLHPRRHVVANAAWRLRHDGLIIEELQHSVSSRLSTNRRLRHHKDGRHARRVGLLLQAKRAGALAAGEGLHYSLT